MGKLIYLTNISLDGFIEDDTGDFNWTDPDERLFEYFAELVSGVSTFVYGRRLYEAMSVWESDPSLAAQTPLYAEFARVWSRADKVVHSTTLAAPATKRTRIERAFDAAAVADLKERSVGDLHVGGADLAGQAIAAGLVDECHLIVHPILVGSGKPVLPVGARVQLKLLETRQMPGGAVSVRYAVTG